MEFYLAPMEGITGYVFRNAHHEFYHTVDKYFTPFIAPNQNRCMNTRELQDVLPEHNEGLQVVPQILTNRAEHFLRTCERLQELGYREVNLNLGCPSGTVVSKRRGAGFLAEPEMLDAFLEEVFQGTDMAVSIKTRLGIESASEFPDLMKLYSRYPLAELIIHPRLQKDFYKNNPNWEAFGEALAASKTVVCYNGDIFTREHYLRFTEAFPDVNRIMAGRGVLVDPNLIGQIRDGSSSDLQVLRAFHDRLLQDYGEVLSGERNLLFKMKELWFYLCHSFRHYEKPYKKIRKAGNLSDYMRAVDEMFCAGAAAKRIG